MIVKPKLQIKTLNKTYPKENKKVIDNLSLDIYEGEFVIIVGPSGCGKTTLLSIIAGLLEVDSGQIFIDGKDLSNEKPSKRNISMMFQNYVLYPYMSVYDNISFPLRIKKYSKEDIKSKTNDALEKTNLSIHAKKMPASLSGGEQQRVALARLLVSEKEIFLMDEPLANLDARLKISMRKEILELHKTLAKTFIYVTHDQTEAMALADKIVVMNEGKIMQFASPAELYDNPNSLFVAKFFSTNEINIIDKRSPLNALFEDLSLPSHEYIALRPEHFLLSLIEKSGYIKASIKFLEYLGSDNYYHLNCLGEELLIKSSENFSVNQDIFIKVDEQKLLLFGKDGERVYA